jgi:sentrin-specific protease 1
MALLQKRSKQRDGKKEHFFNSFLVGKLLGIDLKYASHGYNFKNVENYTGSKRMNVDLSKMEKVFFPTNVGNSHWYLIYADMARKEMHLYDSGIRFGTVEDRLHMMKAVSRYITDELRRRNTGSGDFSAWRHIEHDECAQQIGPIDCGVFTVMNADFISNGSPLWFSQTHISHFRMKIASDIIRGSLNH